MESEIENRLLEIYKNMYIDVNFNQFRNYTIVFALDRDLNKMYKLCYWYDAKCTFDSNIHEIVKIIDDSILTHYKHSI